MLTPRTVSSFSDELLKIAEAAKKKPIPKQVVEEAKREVELWKKLRKASPVPVNMISEGEGAPYGGAYWDQDNKAVGISSKDYEALAHELGHAELDKRMLTRALQSPTSRAAYHAGTPMAALLGGSLMQSAKGLKKGLGLLLPAATMTPTLLSEYLATRKGGKLLEEAGATEAELDKYKKTGRDAFSTYPAAVVPGALLMGFLGHRLSENAFQRGLKAKL